MAYTNFTNCTEQEYLDIIYSQDDKNRIRIWFNNVELEDAGEYCEKLSGTNRIIPNDGKKIFSLGNFISKEYDLVLRDLPQNTVIQDQVKISIGTLVDESNNTYEDVPLGVFNIQDTPTTDKNKTTIKLRDNRVKFDFPYNAKPLIDAHGGSATYLQILDDICTQAGVTNNVGHFSGEELKIGVYDNTIKATNYVAYIAEQCGMIPQIDRNGALIFVDLLSEEQTLTNVKSATLANVSRTSVDNLILTGETTQSGTPTPSNPQEIVNVTGRQEVKVVGKNLFNTTETTRTLIKDTTRTINITPASTLTLQAGTYTISFPDLIMQNNNYGLGVQLYGVESGGQTLTNKSKTITINETKTLQYLYIYLNSNDNANATATFSKIMLEKSSSATSYEPYQEQVNEINLGKNLLNATSNSVTTSGLTITRNADYSYTLNGTYSGNTYWYRLADNFTISAGTYTLSNSNPDVSNNSAIFCDDGNSFSARTNIETKTFTNERTIKPYIRISAGVTFDNFTIKPMIEKGTQATSYSEYFTPIELCKIGNYEDKIFKTTGKNLFDKDNANILNAYINNKQIISNNNARTIYISAKSSTTYTISRQAGKRFGITTTTSTPANGITGTNGIENNTATSITITTGANDKYIAVYFYLSTADTQTPEQILNTMQIEENNQATEYEPYGSGEWYKKAIIGKVVLDGSENIWITWNDVSTGTTRLFGVSVIDDIPRVGYVEMSNYFIGRTVTMWNTDEQGITTAGTGTHTIRIRINQTTADNITALKTWLSTHNTIVYYVLATPTYTKLNDILQVQLNNVKLIEGTNNIISTLPIDINYFKAKTPIRIPLSIIEKYEVGTPYQLQRVVYESGTIKFETSNDETLDTLYLDAANMYINSQRQIETIFDTLRTLNIDSVITGKVLGNPAIDAYDIIEVYDDDDENEPTIFKTFANMSYTFNGVHRNTFDTQIGKEQRAENVTINSGATFQKIVKSEIDNIEGTITNVVSDTQTVSAIVIGTYGLTEDTTYKANKTYYISIRDNQYEQYTNYSVGDAIPVDTIYELTGSKIQEIEGKYTTLDGKIDTTKSDITKEYQKYYDSKISQSASEIVASFTEKYSDYTDLNDETNGRIDEIQKYLKYLREDNSVRLGLNTENIELVLKNNRLAFLDKTSNEEVGYISNNKLYITNAQILTQIQIGNFAFIPRSNGSLGFRKVS